MIRFTWVLGALAFLAFSGISEPVQATVMDDKARVDRLKKHCERPFALACFYLGEMYEYGRGGDQDHEKAIALYRQACDSDVTRGCLSLGKMYKFGSGVEQDDELASALYKQACNSGDSEGCLDLEAKHKEDKDMVQRTH